MNINTHEVKDLLETVRQNREKNKIALTNLVKGILDTDINGRIIIDENNNIVYANPKFCELTGYTNKDVTGKNFYSFIHPEDVQKTLLSEAIDCSDYKIKAEVINRFKTSNGNFVSLKWFNSYYNPSMNFCIKQCTI
jgi:PAS domain S-box-containing protein